MTLYWPWCLLGLIAVAAVAMWALLHPARQQAVVASLELWQKAVEGLSRSTSRRRRVSAAWVLLLLGGIAAVLAAARPVYFSQAPARRIAIAVYPSAELAGPSGMADLRAAAGALLDRLSPLDRVQLLLPLDYPRNDEWLAAAEARRRLKALPPGPVRAEDLETPPPAASAQHLYRFVPAGGEKLDGPRASTVEIPAALGPVTIDAIGGAGALNGAELFVALRNQQDQPWSGELKVATLSAAGATGSASASFSLGANARQGLTLHVPEFVAAAVELHGPGVGQGPAARAYLAMQRVGKAKVAMAGADEPLLRRYAGADASLELAGSEKDADIVVANGVRPPPGKPALVVNPPAGPEGWRRAAELADVELRDADVAADSPIMRNVDWSGVAVRRVAPWAAGGEQTSKALLSYRGQALVIVDDGGVGPGRQPRRVYVAFDLAAGNTNFAMSPSFVSFLGNVMRYLLPNRPARDQYVSVSPRAAGPRPDWQRLPLGASGDAEAVASDLPRPGVYRDAGRAFHAVSLVGLRSAKAPQPPLEAVASLPLPAAEPLGGQLELWPACLVAAMLLWLAGWGRRGWLG